MIEPIHPQLSIVRQCDLLGLARSSYYYQEVPESEENLHLMRLLDEQYTRTPFYGIGKMTAWLRSLGYEVNHKRVERLLRLMGIEAIYPKPRLSRAGGGTDATVSVSAQKPEYRAGESGLEYGHHLYSAAPRICVSGGDSRLV